MTAGLPPQEPRPADTSHHQVASSRIPRCTDAVAARDGAIRTGGPYIINGVAGLPDWWVRERELAGCHVPAGAPVLYRPDGRYAVLFPTAGCAR
jgi:hypothetical protein